MSREASAPATLSPWMTKDETATYCRKSARAIDRDKDFPRVKFGSRVLFNREAVDAYLKSKAV